MKSDQIYQHLIDLSEKLGIEVAEHNFKVSGFPIKSGMCKIKGHDRIVLDKHKSKDEKIDVLIECLRTFPIDDVYMVPAIRDLLDKKGARAFEKPD